MVAFRLLFCRRQCSPRPEGNCKKMIRRGHKHGGFFVSVFEDFEAAMYPTGEPKPRWLDPPVLCFEPCFLWGGPRFN